jgi:hypothetical protein
MKEALVRELSERGQQGAASAIRIDARTYGPRTVSAVKVFQKDANVDPNGVVAEKTWRALGFDEKVVDERPPVLNGVPWEQGVMAVDGKWVDKPLALMILDQRRAGRWGGSVTSGYRPPWYQKRLFDAAVKKYGSAEAASKWVAPPGKSRHGRKNGEGAVDVSQGDQLDNASAQLYRPMSWEPWHVQLAAARDMPEPDGEPAADIAPPTEEELQASGVTMQDVDDSIEVILEKIGADGEPREDVEHVDDGYDPEAQSTSGQ